MIPLEQYAELAALMADTGGDEAKEFAIAAAHGASADAWTASKAGWTAKMSDPSDMGKTALAFMPLYQAAQAKARGGADTILGEPNPKFDPEQAQRFRALMQQESDRVLCILR